MLEPTTDRFRGLARSSPWRWTTLRFTWDSFTGPDGRRPRGEREAVRAFVRRPQGLRVESLDGDVQQVEEPMSEEANRARLDRGVLYRVQSLDDPESSVAGDDDVDGPAKDIVDEPVFNDDGLVVERPWLQRQADEPMWNDYTFVAALDPVELADGLGGAVGTRVEDVRAVMHRDRPSWEAVIHPTEAFEPRCHCCSLLLAPQSFEGVGGVPDGLHWPDAHWVRLDVETGVCVAAEQVGGSRAGTGHEIVIEAVDEPMPDDLFTVRGSGWLKIGSRSSRR